jgi:hypothetical protein
LAAIEKQRTGEAWKSGYIPHASTWLNGDRWLDQGIEKKEDKQKFLNEED